MLARYGLILGLVGVALVAQQPQASGIGDQLRTLRQLPDDARARVTRQLALDIRALSAKDRHGLASELANLATEGDFGRDTLQEVTTTLEISLREGPLPESAYAQLAQLARYEHMTVSLKDPRYTSALAKLASDDEARGLANFTLTDLTGKQWTLKSLSGKIVLVNFWATWCPPCRKEMPDLDVLYKRFKDQGLVILAISDEEADLVKRFIATEQKVGYPVLLDPGRKVNELFRVEGIPKTFIFDRQGKLAAQSIDMRTMQQFLGLLAQAGLH